MRAEVRTVTRMLDNSFPGASSNLHVSLVFAALRSPQVDSQSHDHAAKAIPKSALAHQIRELDAPCFGVERVADARLERRRDVEVGEVASKRLSAHGRNRRGLTYE